MTVVISCLFLRNSIFFIYAFFVLKPGMSQLRTFRSCLVTFSQTLRILLRFCAHICRKNWRLGLRTICLRTKCFRTKCLPDEMSIRTKRLIAYIKKYVLIVEGKKQLAEKITEQKWEEKILYF